MEFYPRKNEYSNSYSGQGPSRFGGTDPSSLRFDASADMGEKASNLRQTYEMRIRAFQDSLKQIYSLVQRDELIETMKQDPASEEFVALRVKEIIDEVLTSQNENLLDQISNQYSSLKVEYAKLQQDYIRLESSTRESSLDLDKRFEELEESLKKERKEREFYAAENETLKNRIKDLSEKYEDALKRKDRDLFQKAERETNELILYKQQINQLESHLRNMEKESHEWDAEKEALKKELERERSRQRDLESDIIRIRNELEDARNHLGQSRKNVEEMDKISREDKLRIKALNDEVKGLKSELNLNETGRQALEERINNKENELKDELISEQESMRETVLKVRSKYKEKIRQYKNKLLEYRDKISNNEREHYEYKRKSNEDRIISEKNAEILQLKAQEQRESLEHKLFLVEDEYQRKIQELHVHYEDQIRDLQEQFQNLLDNRITQIQEDASHQIHTVKSQERELQSLFEEKMYQLEQEYVKLSLHEAKLKEKQDLIDRLKAESVTRQNESREETQQRLKSLEERLKKDTEISESNFQNVLNNFESKLSALSLENKRLESELEYETENGKVLAATVADLESQRKKLFETVEEWGAKSLQLRKIYEEEVSSHRQAQADLQTFQQNMQEIRSAFNDLKQSHYTQGEDLKRLSKENETLRTDLLTETKRSKGLNRELEDQKHENKNAEAHNSEIIKELKDQVSELKKDNKQLNDRIISLIESTNQKFEKEAIAHFENKNSLKVAENILQQRDNEIKNYQTQIEKQRIALEIAADTNSQLKDEIASRDIELQNLAKTRHNLVKENEGLRHKAKDFRNQVRAFITTRLKGFRRDLLDLKQHYETAVSDLAKETAFKLETLANIAKELLWKANAGQVEELGYLRSRLSSEYNIKIQELKEDLDKSHKEAVEALQRKGFSRDKEFEDFKVEFEILRKKNVSTEKELEKVVDRNYKLEEELSQYRADKAHLTKDKEYLEQKLQQAKTNYGAEVQELNRELAKTREENAQQKRELQYKQDTVIKELQNAVDAADRKLERTIVKYEEQFKGLQESYEQDLGDIKKLSTEKIESLTEIIQGLEDGSHQLLKRNRELQEKIAELEKDRAVKEQSKLDLQAEYENRIEELRYHIEEQKLNSDMESDNLQRFKREKTREIEGLQTQVKRLNDDITGRNEKINHLQQEKVKLEDKVRDLQRQLDLRASENDKYKRELFEKQKTQTKEIEQLHSLLSKSYANVAASKENRRWQEPEEDLRELPESDLTKSVKSLKKLDKYLESSKSPKKSGINKTPFSYGRMSQSSDIQEDASLLRTKKPLSVSQLKP